MQLKFKKLHPAAITPKYATHGAACFDLHAFTGGFASDVSPCDAVTFSTGLSFEIPDGYAMLIFSRSGHGFKNDVRLSNCVGVIDADYRGEVKVKLRNDQCFGSFFDGQAESKHTRLVVNHGDRIAQAMIVPYPRIEFIEADALTETKRGTGGFGSTGS